MTTKSKGGSFTFNGTKYDPEQAVDIELSRIFINRAWNARRERAADTVDPTNEKGVEGKRGWANLVCSLATEPQRDPVYLRPNPGWDGKGKTEPTREFTVVAGFGRCDALLFTATGSTEVREILTDPAQGGLTQAAVAALRKKDPTVKAKVQQMTEAEARALNLSENMQRSDLTTQDVVWGVARLHEAAPDMSSVKMAIALNQNQPYIAKLIRIADGTKDVVIPAKSLNQDQDEPVTMLEAWRESPNKLTQSQMDSIAAISDPVKRVEKYVAEATKRATVGETPDPTAPKRGKGVASENAANLDAPRIGAMLYVLQELGIIKILRKVEGEDAVRACMTAAKRNLSEKCTGAEIGLIADAINRGQTDAGKEAKGQKNEKREDKLGKTGKGKTVNGAQA